MNFNLEVISLILCLTSFLSLLLLIYKKMPALVSLPERELFPIDKIKEDMEESLKVTVKEKMHNFEISLQKNLQKSRIFFLKADNRATDMIKRLRERSNKRKEEHDAHWKDIRFSFPIKKNKVK